MTWRVPEVVNALLLRAGSDIEAIAAHRRILVSGLISLLVVDSLLVSIDPTLLSVFIRIRDGTIFNLADADLVLTAFQTLALWMVAMTIVSLFGTGLIIARLVRR